MKVLYLLNYAGRGGTEQYVSLLMNRLKGKGVKSHFAFNISGKLSEKLQKKGIPCFQLTMKHPLDLAAAKKLGKYCKENDINVIHTGFLRENYIAILSKLFNKKVKVVYTNHVMLYNNLPLKILNRVLTPFNHQVIAVCELGKEILIGNGVKENRIKVIHNGVDVNKFETIKDSSIRNELGIDEDTFLVTCLSRFDEFKGNRFLIESIAEFKKQSINKQVKFILTNEGPLWDEMKALSKLLNVDEDIIFLGFRKDVLNILKGSDLYINPSEWEALSFAIIEALGSGLPVLSTNTGGTKDVINSETNCGLLVDYKDTKAVADGLKKIIEDEAYYMTLKNNSSKVVNKWFNIEDMIKKTYQAYK